MSDEAASAKEATGSVARGVLHVAAGIGALVVALSFLFFLHFEVDGRGIGPILVAALAASQVGALAGWPLIDRSVAAGRPSPAGNGLFMALIVHLSLGPLWFCVVSIIGGGKVPSDLGGLWVGVLFISYYSTIFVGWATAPVAMIVASFVGRLRCAERAARNAA